jgi:glycosyltransferase involved in cell wall biosynthesis
MKIAAIILTFNEELHIKRCIASILQTGASVFVVDSYSTDKTVDIARSLGVRVVQHTFINHAAQFNWAIENLPLDCEWIMRIDADEILDDRLAWSIANNLTFVPLTVNGIFFKRKINFLGGAVNFGGVCPVKVLRLFRRGFGGCENRWMDEHIVVTGSTTVFEGLLIDDNLNSLTWWVDKHNAYASKEAIEMLNLEFDFLSRGDGYTETSLRGHSYLKRSLKENVYRRMPLFLRSTFYFGYRYVIRLGFIDALRGSSYHFLQGFWYRHLVDLKINEVKKYQITHSVSIIDAIEDVLNVRLPEESINR